MAPVGPWAQPKATRREGGRRAERPVGSYATPDTPCSRTARRAPADRSPRRIATWAASGVAVPLAFFCTLFFRHRKKSVSAPWDGQSQLAPESVRHSPSKGISSAKLLPVAASRGAFRSPPCTPFGSPTETIERPIGLQALLPRRSRRVRPRRGQGIAPAGTHLRTQGHPPANLFPSRRPPHEDHRPHRRYRLR